jgi:hypothetical protein
VGARRDVVPGGGEAVVGVAGAAVGLAVVEEADGLELVGWQRPGIYDLPPVLFSVSDYLMEFISSLESFSPCIQNYTTS